MKNLITFESGRPVILHNGKPVSQAGYCDYIHRGDWADRVREFVDSGVKVFYLSGHPSEVLPWWGFPFTPQAWDKTPASEWLTFARQADIILAMQPEALFYIRPMSSVPAEWAAKYPDEMQTDEAGKRYEDASLPSERFRTDVDTYLRALVNHCESQPWGDRIVGYLEAPYGEGAMPLTFANKRFDCSPANETAFRAWVAARYASDADLQQAWQDASVTRTSVRVPRDSAWLAKCRRMEPTLKGKPAPRYTEGVDSMFHPEGLFHWIEAQNAAPELDYCRFIRDMFFRKFSMIARVFKTASAERGRQRLVGFDITKQPLMGWQIISAFSGIGDGRTFLNTLQCSGSWDVGDLLDDENIDVIFTPADYHARTVGFAYEAEGCSDSLLLRGKTMIVENDARCYVGAGAHEQGAFRNEAEVEAGLLRNAAFTLSRGIQSYWCNVGSSYFHDKGIHKTVARLTPMLDRLNTAPHRETPHAVAFIIDDEGPMHEDFTCAYQTIAVIWQRIFGLAHCGLPYRIFLLSDLKKDNFPAYRTYLFPNLFRVDDEVMALLKAKVLRNGNMAIFGPATGITDGRFLGAEGASALLGVPMELVWRTTRRDVIVQDAGHPLARELPASLTYGDSLTYGPTMVPEEGGVERAGAVPLGHANLCWQFHRTGLFLKETGLGAAGNGKPGLRGAGDCAMLWSVAMPLPSSLLRAAARYAGSHIWCEADDVIYASDSLVAIHTVKAGPRTVKLPQPCTVTDAMTNKTIGIGLTEIRLRMTCPQTRIFTLE
jgi:hypothetical protein